MNQQEITELKANDIQVAGNHYRGKNADYQHWDLVANAGMGYFDGQITKYVSRWRDKNGLQDLKKSRHFAVKYAELMHDGVMPERVVRKGAARIDHFLNRYLLGQEVQPQEAKIVTLLTQSHNSGAVQDVIVRITELIEAEELRLSAAAEATPAYVNQG